MSANPVMLPFLIIPLTFLFVLLIVLIAKSPRTGAWLVAGLVFAAPGVLWMLLRAGMLAHGKAIPVVLIPAMFLFVLLIILLGKAPKPRAGLIVALVVMGLVGLFFAAIVSDRPRAAFQPVMPIPPAVPQALPGPGGPPQPPAAPSPIWSAGVEQEMAADVYPSKLAAARAGGERLGKSIRELSGDANTPPSVVIFQEAHEYRLVAELRDALRRTLPEVSCEVEAQNRALAAHELGITLYLGELDMRPVPWAVSGETEVDRKDGTTLLLPVQSEETTMLASGQFDLNLSGAAGRRRLALRFTEKPWLEDFATFASKRPQRAFIIARSFATCTSESEANQQALDDARARLTEAISQRRQWITDKLPQPEITTTDVLQGGFVVDRFAQSFEGTVGRVWRQALLVDVSGWRLARLADQKAREFRAMRMSWARMGFSVIGVVVLIAVIYFFLNMATMGYYEWSLRIAGVILAIVAIISILMVVR